jgi:hypothetical protein
VSLLLVFDGIHNAWDAVTYIALDRNKRHPHHDHTALVLARDPCRAGSSCARPAPTQANKEAALRALFEADQAERSGPIEQIDMDRLNQIDSTRRDSLRALVTAGVLASSTSYYHAAMLMQHGIDSLAYHQAYEWARESEALDSTRVEVRWLVAAAWEPLPDVPR